MTDFQKIVAYVESLVAAPETYETDQQASQQHLLQLVNSYCDSRPPTLEEMIDRLREEFPSIEENVSLISRGNELRSMMIDKLFSDETTPAEVDQMKAKIAIFELLVRFNNTVTLMIQNVKGEDKGKEAPEIVHTTEKGLSDKQGTAQSYLTRRGNGKGK